MRVFGAWVAAAVLVVSAPAAAAAPGPTKTAPEMVRILDVPYVPQSGLLCGGAALAMVLRYWGATGVRAEDFAALVEPDQGGIRTGVLVKAVEARGWTALPFAGTPDVVAGHLAQGRPVIALIQAGAGSHHYVVLLAWANGRVVLHDPNAGPFRTMPASEFQAAWSGTGNWALLILPPAKTKEIDAQDHAAVDSTATVAPDSCDVMVEAGIHLAQQGDTTAAELKFLAAQSLCPANAAPLRERAGLRFLAEDWAGASRLAKSALALDPSDVHTWRLLAGSRFLAGDLDGALGAWNHLSEPLNDLTRIDGLRHTRYSVVAGLIDLPPGRLITAHAFRRARHRLAELPAKSEYRLSLRPLPDGKAQVNAALLERPLVFDGPWDMGGAAIKAITKREVTLEVASPTGNGELWTAGWRWWQDRPRVSMALAVPAAGRPGIWRLEGFWERQAYAAPEPIGAQDLVPTKIMREERRRTALSVADWLGPDLRLEAGVGLDEWADRGSHLSLEGAVETRWSRDHVSLAAGVTRWVSTQGGVPFGTSSLSCTWSSTGLDNSGDAWLARLGASSATTEAPLALWSGAGTGNGRAPLLRAHPLLDGGVIHGRVFGRTLVHGTTERQVWQWHLGPLHIGWVVFVDAAKTLATGWAGRVPWQVDGGTGLRLRGLGVQGQMRIDGAYGFADGNSALSIGWQVP